MIFPDCGGVWSLENWGARKGGETLGQSIPQVGEGSGNTRRVRGCSGRKQQCTEEGGERQAPGFVGEILDIRLLCVCIQTCWRSSFSSRPLRERVEVEVEALCWQLAGGSEQRPLVSLPLQTTTLLCPRQTPCSSPPGRRISGVGKGISVPQRSQVWNRDCGDSRLRGTLLVQRPRRLVRPPSLLPADDPNGRYCASTRETLVHPGRSDVS